MNKLPLVALLLLTGCPKGSGGGWTGMPESLKTWVIFPQTTEYRRINRAGPLPLPDVDIRDDWSGPSLDGNRLLYDVQTTDVTEGVPRPLEQVRHFVDETGYGYLGTFQEDGSVQVWDPPQVVLPLNPKVGDTWSGTHTKGQSISERSCEIMASDICEGGLVPVCESKRDGGRIILRDHFCPGIGWVGFEAMVLMGSNPPVRMWSVDLARDGVMAPQRAYSATDIQAE